MLTIKVRIIAFLIRILPLKHLFNSLIAFSCVMLILNQNVNAQGNYAWWNQVHNWDGITHWSQYITYSPSFMGPNSIPVPEMKKGFLTNKLRFENGLEGHWSKGDNTYNLFQKLSVPIVKDRVTLESWIVPIEYYKTDSATRDERAARKQSGEGIEGGDFYFSTLIQLIKNKEKLPDILLSLNFKTTSGTGLANARFTDAPGYFFDISFHKEYGLSSKNNSFIHIYALTGLFIYQTHIPKYFQNDAIMLALGTDLELNNYIITNQICSYLGYIKIGDKPVVYRLEFEKKNNLNLKWKLNMEHGIHDFPFTSARISLLYDIPLTLY